MARRILLQTLLVVAMLIIAGCSGTPTDVGESDSLNPTTDTDPSGNDGDLDGDGTNGAEPDGDDASVFSDPERALLDAGTFTSTWIQHVTDGDVVVTSEMTHIVDLESETSLVSTVNSDGTGDLIWDYYFVDGMEYMRMQTPPAGSAPTYLARQADFEGDSLVYDHGFAYHESALSDWSETGMTTYDGVSVREYVYTGTEFWAGSTGGSTDTGFDVSDIEFRMLVDNDGIARYQSFSIDGVDEDGTLQTVEWEYVISDIGTTVIEDPAWFADAVAQTE